MTKRAAQEICEEPAAEIPLMLHDAAGVHPITAGVGEQLLFPLRRAGVELAAICNAKGACGTCRIHVATAWRDRLPDPEKREMRLLAHVGAAEGDRLACRIVLTPNFAGLEVHACNEKEHRNVNDDPA